MIGSDKRECFVEMRMISGSGYTALHIGCTNRENIITGCITSLETGIYNVILLSCTDPTSTMDYWYFL